MSFTIAPTLRYPCTLPLQRIDAVASAFTYFKRIYQKPPALPEAFALYYAFFAECSNLVVAVAEDGFKYLIRVLSEAWAATPDHAG